jgi:hypothetical protein
MEDPIDIESTILSESTKAASVAKDESNAM